MEITVTGRHVSVTPPIKEYARKKIENLAGIEFPHILEAHVILDVEKKFRHIAEVVLVCNSHITIEASEVSEDLYASIDKVVDKCARQMRKFKTKIQNHRPRMRKAKPITLEEQVFTPDFRDESDEGEPKKQHHPIRTEKLDLKPMFVDEAALQMELSERQFLVFLNADSEKINVMYRRKNGDFGLIVPNV
jgi:putative sigma-54 modulation protein